MSFYYTLYVLCFYVCGYTCAMVQVFGSQRITVGVSFFLPHVGQGLELG